MPNEIAQILSRHRRLLAERERRTVAELRAAYGSVEKELVKEFLKLSKWLAALPPEQRTRGAILRHAVLRELLDQVRAEIRNYGGRVGRITAREQRYGILSADRNAREMLVAQTRNAAIRLNFDRALPKRVIETAVGLMGDGSPINEYFENAVGKKLVAAIRDEIVKTIATGDSFGRLAKNLQKRAGVMPRQAHAIARTEVNRARRETTRQIYESQGITEWEWVAANSLRTCILCLTLDGQRFSIKDPFPTHVNCRCTMIAVHPNITHKRRTGREWLATRSAEEQEKVIGKEAFAAYERGEITLDDLVTFRTSKKWGRSAVRRPLKQALNR